eukprot:403339233
MSNSKSNILQMEKQQQIYNSAQKQKQKQQFQELQELRKEITQKLTNEKQHSQNNKNKLQQSLTIQSSQSLKKSLISNCSQLSSNNMDSASKNNNTSYKNQLSQQKTMKKKNLQLPPTIPQQPQQPQTSIKKSIIREYLSFKQFQQYQQFNSQSTLFELTIPIITNVKQFINTKDEFQCNQQFNIRESQITVISLIVLSVYINRQLTSIKLVCEIEDLDVQSLKMQQDKNRNFSPQEINFNQTLPISQIDFDVKDSTAKKRNSHINNLLSAKLLDSHNKNSQTRQPNHRLTLECESTHLVTLKKQANIKKYLSHSPESIEKIKLQKFLVTKGLNPTSQLLKKFTSESPHAEALNSMNVELIKQIKTTFSNAIQTYEVHIKFEQ